MEPKMVGLSAKENWVESKGLKLHTWHFQTQAEKAKGTIVFFHGNAENLTSHYLKLIWVLKEGYDFVIFDYPGYGISQGAPNAQNTYEAGVKVIEFVHREIDPRPLIIYGESLGGIISMRGVEEIKNRIPIKLLIVDSSFHSYQEMGRRFLARSWVTWIFQPLSYLLLSDEFAPRDLKSLSPIPILFIHSRPDRVVEFECSEKMYEKALEPKTFWRLDNGGHGYTFITEKGRYQKDLIQFIDNLGKAKN